MSYINRLNTKRPDAVKIMIKKLFNVKNVEDVIGLNPIEKSSAENAVFYLINKEKDGLRKIMLEDFAIYYGENGLECLEMIDRRFQEYLKFMAKLYGNEYLQDFHKYRIEERKELIKEFNTTTCAMESMMAEALNSLNQKEDSKTL